MESVVDTFWSALDEDVPQALPHESTHQDFSPIVQASELAKDDWDITRAAAHACGLTVLESTESLNASAHYLESVPIGFSRRHGVLGVKYDAKIIDHQKGVHDHVDAENYQPNPLILLVSSLAAARHRDTLSRWLSLPLQLAVVPHQALLTAINAAYQQKTGQADAAIAGLERRDVLKEVGEMPGREDLLDVDSRAPVIKLVNLMLFEAVKMLASDVHIQPYEDRLVVRLRIDGVLFDQFDLPTALLDEIVSRIKVLGKMNIAEKRLPQDGRATAQVGDRAIDLRISTVPTSFGERVVIRLLDKSVRLYTLSELGMAEESRQAFLDLIHIEHGLVLVTGPTGSGKSTTLYAALQEINTDQRNVMTLEDPIEYQLPGISQMQVSEKKGMTFAKGLRSVLRQDPDIIMVGEIRDHDTAVMAIQSALTGHLVFSTLHTNDAPSAVTRLLDLGIEPYLVASSVVGVIAQRLVRRVCPSCSQAHIPEASELARLGLELDPDLIKGMRIGKGCSDCRHTGYRGREGIFEMMRNTDSIRLLIQDRANASQIKSEAIRQGMHTLREEGIQKVLKGRSTVDEIVRVTMRSTSSSDI